MPYVPRHVWTVIGYWSDNKQPHAAAYTATSYEEAEALSKEVNPDVVIVGVVAGSHVVYGGDNEHGVI